MRRKSTKVGLDEAQASQVAQLVFGERQRAQVVELRVHVGQQFCEWESALVAADEAVLSLCLRVAMQHGLPHRELVEIGFEQAANDRGHVLVSFAVRRFSALRWPEG